MTKLLSVQKFAESLSISPWTVRKNIRKGKLQVVRIGRRVLLEETELERFVADSKPREKETTDIRPNQISPDGDAQ